ncbi:1,2-phenylacetyl-CoA epoxidase subunit PaaD [Ideonella livida]|uniref:Phenylacetate-CoA oxygenase subunit PaaJ n=1 Tax=Ideonella livida TaxID=2707176 RepID=A0A7C9TMT7_9BURK|nr:1,2-phenylacetyl-CoA epoxidase subunit PaaD [Ideonella livida]NDY92885.1 phenylacetate-CoA oxygenase subunit PaaJ [Ideonella livida]
MCGAELRSKTQVAWEALQAVPDPEVPAISLVELGIVREVTVDDDGTLAVVLTPTYSGCPATEVIEASVKTALEEAGLAPLRIEQRRAPAWTTDWISPAGRDKLRAYGIAPPGPVPAATEQPLLFMPRPVAVPCPRCGSARTERLSAFGATACKALYRCVACREPFEHFKPI